MTGGHNLLWSDEPAGRDLLSFVAVAQTVADVVLDERLDPVALSVSGAWGSGKTTAGQTQALVVPTQPWRYDPGVGPKKSLIAEVLEALRGQIDTSVEDEAGASS